MAKKGELERRAKTGSISNGKKRASRLPFFHWKSCSETPTFPTEKKSSGTDQTQSAGDNSLLVFGSA